MTKFVCGLLMEYECILANFPGRLLTESEHERLQDIDRWVRKAMGEIEGAKALNEIFDRVICRNHWQ